MSKAHVSDVNTVGLTRADYQGNPSTLCQGCGHSSIANQIAQIAFELGIRPWELVKLSGIGCSSKSIAYFLGQSYGFNTVHGRMPAVATGALLANHHLRAIGVSGDGDTSSIGLGQFKHLVRRNLRLVYLVENNGVYGLTKGQHSATADTGQHLKYAGVNELPPIDVCLEAIVAGGTFVARSFAGDAPQVRELLKAALRHNGTAVLDIISPCVAFNNREASTKSYAYGKAHQVRLHGVDWVPPAAEIEIDPSPPGEARVVELHDGSQLRLRRLEADYDPGDRPTALQRLCRAQAEQELVTGLLYHDPKRPSLAALCRLGETPLTQLDVAEIRPLPLAFDQLMADLS